MRRLGLWLLICLAMGLPTASAQPPERQKVIIDQDAFGLGGPNLQPILMLLQSPEIEVLGITVESGDGWQKENVAHTLRMLELIGRTDIPVLAGASFPLINSELATKRWEKLYGKLAYKGAWTRSWPAGTVTRTPYHSADVVPPLLEGAPTLKPGKESAAAFMLRKVHEFPDEVTILGLGPFTNIALAARLDEGFAAHAKQIVIMGGAFNPDSSGKDEFSLQFIYNPRTEFNMRWDPEAAQMMLHAGWKKITVIPLDATVSTQLTPAMVKEVAAVNTPVARYFARYAEAGFPMWDEVAAAVLIQPSIVTASTQLAMDIVIDHGAAYGATLSWSVGAGQGLGEPDVAVDAGRLDKLFVQQLQGKS